MRIKGWKPWIIGAALLASAGVAIAQVDAAAVIKERQENMKAMSKSATRLVSNLSGATPDIAEAKVDAADLAERLGKIPSQFPKGTGPSSGVATDAHEELFSQLNAFKFRSENAQDDAKAVIEALDAGDIVKAREAGNKMRGGCSSCHEVNRV